MRSPVRPGDVYKDCANHPVWCYEAEPVTRGSTPRWRAVLHALAGRADDWDIAGVSLLDGSRPRSCSARHCAVRPMPAADVLEARKAWEASMAAPWRGEWGAWADPRAR